MHPPSHPNPNIDQLTHIQEYNYMGFVGGLGFVDDLQMARLLSFYAGYVCVCV